MGISTHILDTALGRPAAWVPVVLSIAEGGGWIELHATSTDEDGRCKQLLPESHLLRTAHYKIRFATADYYKLQMVEGLYPCVEITFTVTNTEQHYHVPLLLTANGYTTYRGS
ncbi:hydroxyisourate hydrolase [Granulicella arctica]|uniref:hydroxyisourate hydrolase n=1 Tax=Granulicella arctica TaxID=940613 RepID=UPI0021DF9F3F|nr:hydroxyisourate hydrolase [Granulicella arctica]